MIAVLHRLARAVATLVLLTLIVGVLGGSSCHSDYDDDDDDDFLCDDDSRFDDDDDDFDDDDDGGLNCDDDDDDDDDDVFYGASHGVRGDDSFLLEDFELNESPGGTARQLTGIENVSIFGLMGPGEYGDRDFERFTAEVMRANQDVLGIQADGDSLKFREVQFFESAIVVTWQELEDSEPVPGGLVTFTFDLLGNLREIDHRTQAAASASEPLPGQR